MDFHHVTNVQFLLSGLTYSTDTAARVAVARSVVKVEGGERRTESTLFRTPFGVFFVADHIVTKTKGRPLVQDAARALTPEECVAWIAENNAAILDATGLPLPPSA